MTLSVAWIRKAGISRELIVASDSRLTSAGHVDICQKIFHFARGDAFFAFCGDTFLAFPLLFQIQSAIDNFKKAMDRSEDVTDLVTRVLLLINSYKNAWSDTIEFNTEEENKITRFLFGGWSWRHCKFYIYPIQYNRKARRFTLYTHSKQVQRLHLEKGEKCIAIGNYTAEFRSKLAALIREKKLSFLDYEPLEILAEMLSELRFTDRRSESAFYNVKDRPGAIGGASQALKIYQHANIRPIAVRWPLSPGSQVTLFGRPLFDWEKTLNPIYDPVARTFRYPLGDVRNINEDNADKSDKIIVTTRAFAD